jgi:hypothetical protein
MTPPTTATTVEAAEIPHHKRTSDNQRICSDSSFDQLVARLGWAARFRNDREYDVNNPTYNGDDKCGLGHTLGHLQAFELRGVSDSDAMTSSFCLNSSMRPNVSEICETRQ